MNHWFEIPLITVFTMGLGALWYSDLMFAGIWMKNIGKSKKEIEREAEKGMFTLITIEFFGKLLTTSIMGHILTYCGAYTIGEHLQLGIYCWAGFIFPTLLSKSLWENKNMVILFLNCMERLCAHLLICSLYYLL